MKHVHISKKIIEGAIVLAVVLTVGSWLWNTVTDWLAGIFG